VLIIENCTILYNIRGGDKKSVRLPSELCDQKAFSGGVELVRK